jgi:hypothetical protein
VAGWVCGFGFPAQAADVEIPTAASIGSQTFEFIVALPRGLRTALWAVALQCECPVELTACY